MQTLKFKILQSFALFCGTVFAFYTVYNDFVRFYSFEGTIFKIRDCIIPNPVTTACFYGAFAFLIAFIWSLFILRFGELKQKIHQKRLIWFLIAGVLFAWSNFSNELIKFYNAGSKDVIGCSGILTKNPFTTPCFIGASIFLASLIISIISYYKSQTSHD